jgi:hypothetical protein
MTNDVVLWESPNRRWSITREWGTFYLVLRERRGSTHLNTMYSITDDLLRNPFFPRYVRRAVEERCVIGGDECPSASGC